METAEVLHRYRHMPSFNAIHDDCEAAIGRLNQALKEQLALKGVIIYLEISFYENTKLPIDITL